MLLLHPNAHAIFHLVLSHSFVNQPSLWNLYRSHRTLSLYLSYSRLNSAQWTMCRYTRTHALDTISVNVQPLCFFTHHRPSITQKTVWRMFCMRINAEGGEVLVRTTRRCIVSVELCVPVERVDITWSCKPGAAKRSPNPISHVPSVNSLDDGPHSALLTPNKFAVD